MSTFILQKIQSPLIKSNNEYFWFLQEEAAALLKEAEYQQFLYPSGFSYEFKTLSMDQLHIASKEFCSDPDNIPVGSVEFVNKFLEQAGHLPMKPVNIPNQLQAAKLARRKIKRRIRKNEVLSTYKEWNCNELFVKSASRVKDGITDIYTEKEAQSLPNGLNDYYFISEVIDFKSEFRVFVDQGEILDFRQYAGPLAVPDYQYIKDCVQTIDRSIPSYTLDVGCLKHGQTDIVEVHPFVSCGLYGFSHSRILGMTKRAWKWVFEKTTPVCLDESERRNT